MTSKVSLKCMQAESDDWCSEEEVWHLLQLVVAEQPHVPVLALDERVHGCKVGHRLGAPAPILHLNTARQGLTAEPLYD
ncbi:hypothetical protein ON010_g10034 [Phytophthora cinnamomi]|nr:hypothetical protein ON010_g10034 [Phytophthora cinnamomi]